MCSAPTLEVNSTSKFGSMVRNRTSPRFSFLVVALGFQAGLPNIMLIGQHRIETRREEFERDLGNCLSR